MNHADGLPVRHRLIHNIDVAARVALEKISAEDVALREVAPVDKRKFDSIEH